MNEAKLIQQLSEKYKQSRVERDKHNLHLFSFSTKVLDKEIDKSIKLKPVPLSFIKPKLVEANLKNTRDDKQKASHTSLNLNIINISPLLQFTDFSKDYFELKKKKSIQELKFSKLKSDHKTYLVEAQSNYLLKPKLPEKIILRTIENFNNLKPIKFNRPKKLLSYSKNITLACSNFSIFENELEFKRQILKDNRFEIKNSNSNSNSSNSNFSNSNCSNSTSTMPLGPRKINLLLSNDYNNDVIYPRPRNFVSMLGLEEKLKIIPIILSISKKTSERTSILNSFSLQERNKNLFNFKLHMYCQYDLDIVTSRLEIKRLVRNEKKFLEKDYVIEKDKKLNFIFNCEKNIFKGLDLSQMEYNSHKVLKDYKFKLNYFSNRKKRNFIDEHFSFSKLDNFVVNFAKDSNARNNREKLLHKEKAYLKNLNDSSDYVSSNFSSSKKRKYAELDEIKENTFPVLLNPSIYSKLDRKNFSLLFSYLNNLKISHVMIEEKEMLKIMHNIDIIINKHTGLILINSETFLDEYDTKPYEQLLDIINKNYLLYENIILAISDNQNVSFTTRNISRAHTSKNKKSNDIFTSIQEFINKKLSHISSRFNLKLTFLLYQTITEISDITLKEIRSDKKSLICNEFNDLRFDCAGLSKFLINFNEKKVILNLMEIFMLFFSPRPYQTELIEVIKEKYDKKSLRYDASLLINLFYKNSN